MSNIVKRLNFNPTGGASSASGITYDNDESGLQASNVQEAIDELNENDQAEALARFNADSQLQSNIDAEIARATAAEATKIPLTQKGAANGVATLDGAGLVPASQLPSYVDDVLEFANLAAFPVTGETGKIYIAQNTNFQYRWSGSAYFQLSVSPVSSVFARTGAVVAVNGDYTASQVTNVPSGNLSAITAQAALNELQSDVDTRALQSALQAEIDRAQAEEAGLQSDVDDVNDRVDQEILDRAAADTTIQGNLTAHINSTTAHSANHITYSGTTSGLTAVQVQAAIDELATRPKGAPGDINETSFSIANNQSTFANVTGFSFNTAVVRSFDALVSVEIDATSDSFEEFKISGIHKGASYSFSVEAVGDDSGIEFDVTSAGQVQYKSTNSAGFVTGVLKFRAVTTSA